MFRTQSTPVAEHYGLRNTTCLYSKDVASEKSFCMTVCKERGPHMRMRMHAVNHHHAGHVAPSCQISLGKFSRKTTKNWRQIF
jgi:hypothetical protein